MAKYIFITAAEVSGDRNSAELIRALRKLEPSIEIEGLGGSEMSAAGAKIHFETVRGAAMALHGLKRVREMWRLLRWFRKHHSNPRTRPDLQICVDSSAINLPFARAAKESGVPVLYYVAPQLWASREGRMKKLRANVEKLACIFPFEEPYFRKHGIDATFVGHPLFDRLPADRASREGMRFPDHSPIIGIVPGSRESEARANFGKLIDVAQAIREKYRDAKFLIPTTPAANDYVRATAHARGFEAEIQIDAFDQMIPQCDLCLTKSGTSTLHVAAFGVPMIVVYHAPPLLWKLVGRRLVTTRKIAMVNILAGQIDLVPEFIPFDDVNVVIACALDLLSHPEKLASQRAALLKLVEPLSARGASMNVAKIAIEMIYDRH